MKTLGALTSRVQKLIDDTSSESEADIHEHINTALEKLVGKANFQQFIEQVTISSAVLPGDLLRPIFIEDDTDVLYFNINGAPERYQTAKLYNWWINLSITDILLGVTDAVVTANSTSVTSATGGFDASWAGEYVRIGENTGVYKISSVTDTNTLVLTKGFRGASATGQYLEVRPEGTLNIAQTDESGGAITSTTTKLWYVRKPLPLYNDYDKCLLPGSCEAVALLALRDMLETEKYATDAQRKIPDYDIAWAEMKSQATLFTGDRAPRDRNGSRIRFGRTGAHGNDIRSDGVHLRYG